MKFEITKEWCINMARQEDDYEVSVGCSYCDGSGKVEMDNNGPILDCPVCELNGKEKSE